MTEGKWFVIQFRKTKGARWTDWEAFANGNLEGLIGLARLDREKMRWQAVRIVEREEAEKFFEE